MDVSIRASSHRWGLLEKPALAGEMDGLSHRYENKRRISTGGDSRLRLDMLFQHHPILVHGVLAILPKSPEGFRLNVC